MTDQPGFAALETTITTALSDWNCTGDWETPPDWCVRAARVVCEALVAKGRVTDVFYPDYCRVLVFPLDEAEANS